jgi:hypothetical protein
MAVFFKNYCDKGTIKKNKNKTLPSRQGIVQQNLITTRNHQKWKRKEGILLRM